MAQEISVVLSPAQLEEFSKVDPNLPALVVAAGIQARSEEYKYAVAGLAFGFFAFLTMVVGFIFLVIHGYSASASILLGTGVLGLVAGFVRARLTNSGEGKTDQRYRIVRKD